MRLLNVLTFSLPIAAALRSSGNGALHELSSPELAAKRVAIIGAGAGGSSAAYYLSQFAKHAGIATNVTVFDRNPYIGGRTTTVNAWDDDACPIELGGSIFVEVNHILTSAAKHFNLSTQDDEEVEDGRPELGVWDGNEFVVVVQDSDALGWWDNAKLLWRYGFAPIRTNALMKSTVAKFLKMYEEPLFPWKSLNDAVEEVGLKETTGVTGEQFLKANSIGGPFAREIIQASTRVNYAQNIALIHGLETMVCMATNGAVAVKGGNWRIFSEMLKASKATTHLETTVNKISKQADGTFLLTTDSKQSPPFDEVILASPLQFADLDIDPSPKHVPDEIPYVKLYVTLFASPFELDPRAFKMKAGSKVPKAILTTLGPDERYGSDKYRVGRAGFFSISIVGTHTNPKSSPKYRREYIYKIFSLVAIDSEFLSHVLGQKVPKEEVVENGAITWIHHKMWHSYPFEYPRVTFEEIALDEGLWYTSGIESFISTMETSALMGKNVGRLIVDKWLGSEERSKDEKEKDAEEKLEMQVQSDWQFQGSEDTEQKPLKAKL